MTQQTSTQSVTVWQIDPAHSVVEFGVKHMMFTTVKGQFKDFQGIIRLDEADPSRSHVEAEIRVASIDTRDERRDEHLRSPDFFDAEQHPLITFRSTRTEPAGEDQARVHGDLTIAGVTKPVVIETTFNGRGTTPYGAEVVGFTGRSRINRKDFGLMWNAALETGGWLVGDDVTILLEVQAMRQE